MRSLIRIALGLCFVGSTACGKAGGSTAFPAPEHDVLTRQEIMASTSSTGDLLEAIQSLRPHFLMVHPSAHSSRSAAALPLAVYISGVRQSAGIEALKSINAGNVSTVKYLDPTAAQNQFGFRATGGALVVTLDDPSKRPDGD